VKRLPIYLSLLLLITCAKDSTEDNSSVYVAPPSNTTNPTPTVTQYTLTVMAGEGGSVSTAGGTYNDGTSISITATPSEGYVFGGWNGNDSNNSTISISLNANTSIEAIFYQMPQFAFPDSSLKIFTKGISDTLSISFSYSGGYKQASFNSSFGSTNIISEPNLGESNGEIVIEYTSISVSNIDWTTSIAGADNISLDFLGNDDISTSEQFSVRTQPEPAFFDYNKPTYIQRNIKYPFDIPKIRYLNSKDNYAEKNTCDGDDTLMGENGISLNQFEDSWGTDATELAEFADFNADGYLDFITYGGYKGVQGHGVIKSPIELYLYENGSYTYKNVFEDVLVYNPAKIYVGDYNNDNKPDLIVSSFNHDNNIDRTNTLVLLNNSGLIDLNFEVIDLGYSSRFNSKSVFDYDQDGFLDYYQYTDSGNIRYKNIGGNFLKDENYFFNGAENAPDFNYSNDFTVADINNDGASDVILTGAEFADKMGIFWGCSEVTNCDSNTQPNFNPNRFTEIPSVIGWGLALEHNLYDLDNDGTLEILINRTGATLEDEETNSPYSDDFHLGWSFQVLKIENNTSVLDVTSSYFSDSYSERQGGPCQGYNHYIFNMGLYDYDNDGLVEFFNLPDQGIVHHEWEWNGLKFIKLSN
jgi:hypothetical protein